MWRLGIPPQDIYLTEMPPPPPLSPLSMLADKLNMTPEEAERWIVNLIRNARLDAKIDSKLVRLYIRWSTSSLMSLKSQSINSPDSNSHLCTNASVSTSLSYRTESSFQKLSGLHGRCFSHLSGTKSPKIKCLWFCLSGSRGDGQQRGVAVPAGDREDQDAVLPQPLVDDEHREKNGVQQQERGMLRRECV